MKILKYNQDEGGFTDSVSYPNHNTTLWPERSFNGAGNEVSGYSYYQNDGRSRPETMGNATSHNPFFENRSPSPSIKRNNQASHLTDFGAYNPLTERRESVQNHVNGDQSSNVLVSLLDEVDDDFRLSIYKMQPSQNSYSNQGYNAYPSSHVPPIPNTFRIPHAGTVSQ